MNIFILPRTPCRPSDPILPIYRFLGPPIPLPRGPRCLIFTGPPAVRGGFSPRPAPTYCRHGGCGGVNPMCLPILQLFSSAKVFFYYRVGIKNHQSFLKPILSPFSRFY